MDSAATTSGEYQDISTTDGYAIPINRALAIAKQIVSGKASATVHIGATAFLGISTAPKQYDTGGQQGAVVATVVPGGAADTAGIEDGRPDHRDRRHQDHVVRCGGRIILSKKPGATLTVAYVDSTGTDPHRSHQAWQRAAA